MPMTYLLAAAAEIAGCFAFSAYFRLGRSSLWCVTGIVSLAIFAWLLTRIDAQAAARTYASYGGIYVAASLLWLWAVEGITPDRWDMLGASLCCLGAAVIIAMPHR